MGCLSTMALHAAVIADLGDLSMGRRLLLKCVVLATVCGMRAAQATLHHALGQVCEAIGGPYAKEANQHRIKQRNLQGSMNKETNQRPGSLAISASDAQQRSSGAGTKHKSPTMRASTAAQGGGCMPSMSLSGPSQLADGGLGSTSRKQVGGRG